MDRGLVFPGSLPMDDDLLFPQQAAMVGLGWLMQAVLGTGNIVAGLQVQPMATPSLSVLVGPGVLTQQAATEVTPFGSLAADSTALMKMGINRATSALGPFTPPAAGLSVAILVQAAYAEVDDTAALVPYWNAGNPGAPYSGPGNSGSMQNRRRRQVVSLSTVTGTPAAPGSVVWPTPTTNAPLAVITLNGGATSIGSGDIMAHPFSPIVPRVLPAVSAISAPVVFTAPTTTTWAVPQGARRLKITAVGAGGGGAGATPTQSGGGGGGGGTMTWWGAVVPGQVFTVFVNAGGAGGGSELSGNDGGPSGVTTGGVTLGASGGFGAIFSSNAAGGLGGTSNNGVINENGGAGTDGSIAAATTLFGGDGGASSRGGNGRGSTVHGANNATGHGSGGGGAYLTASAGGDGASGIVIIEY